MTDAGIALSLKIYNKVIYKHAPHANAISFLCLPII